MVDVASSPGYADAVLVFAWWLCAALIVLGIGLTVGAVLRVRRLRSVAADPNTQTGQSATAGSRELFAQRDAADALRQAEEKYRSIFENTVEGIFQTTPKGRYLSANPALARIYGYDSAEQLITELNDIQQQLYVVPERRQDFLDLMAKNDVIKNFESQVYRRDRSIIWISENVRVIRDTAGRPIYFEGTVEDITERVAAGTLLMEKEAAEAASEAKSTFLARMSHEIRTPLNGVIGMLDLLAGTKLDGRQERYVRIARSSADALLGQINDILDFSKIEAGKLELERIPFELPNLVEDLAEMFVLRAEAKGLELSCHVLPGVPAGIVADPDRIRQILINLVNNALKFTERGEIAVRVEAAGTIESQRPWLLRLSVRDSGIGIPPEQQGRLFTSFAQVDSSVSRRYGGTGLGLAICKQLVDLMGGRIGVDSQPGKGSLFWCEVPVQTAAAVPICRKLQVEKMKSLRVLGVDDNPTNLEILRDQLLSWGFEFRPAVNAMAALGALREAAAAGNPFHLAILDRKLPDLDGLELATEIQSDSDIGDTPLIMLTSLDCSMEAEAIRGLGFAGFLTKPIRQSRLFDTIVNAANRTSPAAEAKKKSDSGVRVLPKGSAEPIRILIADDNEINRLVTGEMLAPTGFTYDLAEDGRKVIDAVRRQSYEVILMDCQMPEMDGFEATAEVRRLETRGELRHNPQRVTIIALTANAIQGDRERCLAAGMDDYITKPIDRRNLLKTIHYHIEQRGLAAMAETVRAETLFEPEPTPAGPLPTQPPSLDLTPLLDLPALLDRCSGDRTFAAGLLERFRKRLPEDVGKIRQSVNAADASQAGKLAHTLRGAAGNLGASSIHLAATNLEAAARAPAAANLSECAAQLERDVSELLGRIDAVLADWRTSFARVSSPERQEVNA